MKNILKEIEIKYPVNTILVNGEQVWPYLRIAYVFAYIRKTITVSKKDAEQSHSRRIIPHRLKTLLKMLRNSFYGLGNWFGKYDYIVLSSTLERRNVNGEYLNKLLDPFIDELGRDRVLYIEYPAPALYPLRKVHTRKIVSSDLLGLLGLLGSILNRLKREKYVIQGKSILYAIQKEYGLKINDVSVVTSFETRRRIFNLVFRKTKPKAIFLSCYYGGFEAAIKAARNSGIAVIELQHGTISKEAPAYNVYIELDKTCFPDYLLVFGRKELETFDNSLFIKPENVYPIGSFYLEHVRKNFEPEHRLTAKMKDYKRSVGVTLQWTMEKPVIEFVCQAANLDKDILYLLIPRRPEEISYSALCLPNNVMIVTDKNFYELIMYVDFHCTAYSTCALEAPSLGVQNILINLDNQSKRFYGKILTDSRVTRYVNTPEQLVMAINSSEKLDRDTVIKLNEDIISVDYEHNIQTFIERLQEKRCIDYTGTGTPGVLS